MLKSAFKTLFKKTKLKILFMVYSTYVNFFTVQSLLFLR